IERFQSARDVAFALDALSGSGSGPGASIAAAPASRSDRERWLWMAATAALAILSIWLRFNSTRATPPLQPAAQRFTVLLPDGIRLPDTLLETGMRLAISPDSTRLAFIGVDAAGNRRLWVQMLNDMAAHEVLGTDGAGGPIWSPDSKWLGFFVRDRGGNA